MSSQDTPPHPQFDVFSHYGAPLSPSSRGSPMNPREGGRMIQNQVMLLEGPYLHPDTAHCVIQDTCNF